MFRHARTGLIFNLVALALPALLWAGFQDKDLASNERFLGQLVNVERGHQGLPTLTYDEMLADLARAQSRDMLLRHFFSHANPDGEGPSERALRLHPELVARIGENLHHVMITPGYELSENMSLDQITQNAIAALMKSPPHRANILSPDYDHIGAGYAASEDEVLITQTFAEEICLLDSAPPKDMLRDGTLFLTGRLFASFPPNRFAVFLKVPDPKATYSLEKGKETVGGRFLDVEVKPDLRFRVMVSLDAGPGEYQVMMGREERLIPGPVIMVR